jgi:NADH-quinone oxidoreductase subunit I
MVDVQVIERRPPVGEPVYLPALVKGLGVTMKHFFANLFGGRRIVTMRYPEERTPYPLRFRGLHRLMLRDDGSLRCVACMLCPTVCPAHCITVIAEDVGPPVEKRARLFEIDELRCIVCGLCVEACPADAIRMDTGIHAPAIEQRAAAIYGIRRLSARGALSSAVQGGEGT